MGVPQRDGLWFGRAVPGTTGCGAGSGGPSQPRGEQQLHMWGALLPPGSHLRGVGGTLPGGLSSSWTWAR